MKLNLFKRKTQNAKKIALCLGGGGAKGFAHIGALRAFNEHNIDFDFCVGTSAGSIIGALYCAGLSAEDILRFGSALEMKDIKSGLLIKADDPAKIGAVVRDIIGNTVIENLPKPFYAVATDLVSAKQIIIDKGPVADAVSASSAVPILFKPVIKEDMHLVDGGLINNIPADVCKMLGADAVVTVDVNPTRASGTSELGFFDILKATFSIMSANASLMGKIHSDIFIAVDTSDFTSFSKEGYEQMVEAGYNAALEKLPEIIALIQNQG